MSLLSEVVDQSDFGAHASYLKRGLNSYGAEFYASLELGDRTSTTLEFYQPLDYASRFFIAPNIGYREEKVVSLGIEYDFEETVGDWRVSRNWVEFNAGVNLRNDAQLQIGLSRNSGQYTFFRVATEDLAEDSYDEGDWQAVFKYDTLDNFHFPSSGSYLYADYQYLDRSLGADVDFTRARITGQTAWSIGPDALNTIILSGRVFASEDASLEPQNLQQRGGLISFSGLPHKALSGRQLAFVMAQYQRRLTAPGVLPFVSPIYAGVSLEGGQFWRFREEIDFNELNYAGSLYIGTDTPLGPVYLACGHTSDSGDTFYLALSWPFQTEVLRPGR